MSTQQRKTVRSSGLPHLNEIQKAYVIFQLSEDQRVRDIVPKFRETYPLFGAGVAEKRLKRLLSERFRKMRESQKESIEGLRELNIYRVGHPESYKYLLHQYQKLWWTAPWKALKKAGKDKNGRPYEIYQFKTKKLLEIMKDVKGMGAVVDILPLTRPEFRLQCLQELCEETPRILLKKVIVDDNGTPCRIHEPQAKIHLEILELACTDAHSSHTTPIAQPLYRLRHLGELWTSTLPILLKRIESEPMSKVDRNLPSPTKLLHKILERAEMEYSLLHKMGLPSKKEMKHVFMADPDRRKSLKAYLFAQSIRNVKRLEDKLIELSPDPLGASSDGSFL